MEAFAALADPTRRGILELLAVGERSAGEIAGPLVVGTGDGALEIMELQPAGKRRMAAAEYLRGLREPPQRAS